MKAKVSDILKESNKGLRTTYIGGQAQIYFGFN
jgi:hypothetical protein